MKLNRMTIPVGLLLVAAILICAPGNAPAGYMFSVREIPEPASMVLLGMGLVGIGIAGRRKK